MHRILWCFAKLDIQKMSKIAITCITSIEREDKTGNTGNHHPAVSDESGSVMLALSHFYQIAICSSHN